MPSVHVTRRCPELDMVDEFRTTQTHHSCLSRMKKVVSENKAVRGVCWCPTCHMLVDRDVNAAMNLLNLMTGRPEEFTRDYCKGQEKQQLLHIRLQPDP
jgi:transposase